MYNYHYKETLEVPLLSYIDDMNKITECGINSLENNVVITKEVEMKRLKFNVGNKTKKSKCEKLHVGKNADACVRLKVGKREIKTVTETNYLGDIVNGSGKNINNIKDRVSKGKGIVINIFSILDTITFGPHFFKIALLLRQSMLVNAVIYNSSIWYNLRPSDFEELKKSR